MHLNAYFIAFKGILKREFLRFIHQRTRFLSALVRPLLHYWPLWAHREVRYSAFLPFL